MSNFPKQFRVFVCEQVPMCTHTLVSLGYCQNHVELRQKNTNTILKLGFNKF